MDTSVATFPQTSLGEPMPKTSHNEYQEYTENLDARLYELAERLVAMVDDEEDYSDEEFSSEMEHDFGEMSENLDEERVLLADSYTQCMQEALRFLVQEEGFAQNHEMVTGLQRHLEAQKSNAVERAVIKTQTKTERLPTRGPALI